jgi:hypothetical protein
MFLYTLALARRQTFLQLNRSLILMEPIIILYTKIIPMDMKSPMTFIGLSRDDYFFSSSSFTSSVLGADSSPSASSPFFE